jgi:hypothetical protein
MAFFTDLAELLAFFAGFSSEEEHDEHPHDAAAGGPARASRTDLSLASLSPGQDTSMWDD